MQDPAVPPTPPPSGPDRPIGGPTPVSPPPRAGGGTPWGKIALFGCLGLFVVGLLLSVAGYFVWRKLKERDELTDQYIEERQGETGEEGIISGDTEITGESETSGSGSTGGVGPPGEPYVVNSSLDSNDRVRDDGTFYEEFTFDMSGGNFVVTMRSSDFDSYLTVYTPSGETLSDDDSGGGSDARVEVGLNQPGTYRIWANAYAVGEGGDYTLTIEPLR